jgi:DNA-binding NarL/FixJ family response regulator
MTTATVPSTRARTRAVPPAPRRPGLPGTLRSELTKILSVRSTYWTLLALVAASIGWAVLYCAGTVSHGAGPAFNAAFASLLGQVALGELVIVVLGALVITSEYSTGMIRTSLAVMPRRGVLYAAKAIVFAAVTATISVVTSFVDFFVGQAILSTKHLNTTLVRAGFAMVLSSQPDIAVVGEAADGAAAVRLARECPADVMVMDVRMPGLDGVAATREICQAAERPRVLILTTFDLDEYAFATLRAGASGFLLKSAPPEELLYAIRSVHIGDSVVAPSTTRRLIGRFLPHLPATGEPPPGLTELTARERQVLAEVGSGLSNAEIAALLHISEATVKTHVGHIMTKLGLRDRIQAVVYAHEIGLITPQGLRAAPPG